MTVSTWPLFPQPERLRLGQPPYQSGRSEIGSPSSLDQKYITQSQNLGGMWANLEESPLAGKTHLLVVELVRL